jgi:hypothetical protein
LLIVPEGTGTRVNTHSRFIKIDRSSELGEVVSDVPICSRVVSAKLDALDTSFVHNIRRC